MKIITGDEFGLIKLISTQRKQVIDQYGSLDTSKSIINIFSNNEILDKVSEENSENENNEDFNLFVSSLHENYILNWNTKRIISSHKHENSYINFVSSTIKFPYNDNTNSIFINGTSDNKLNIVTFDEENKYINSSFYKPLEDLNNNLKIKLRNVSNSIYNSDSVYALYEHSPLILYNIQEQKIEFKGKNLPNDELNLRIPIYDTDIVEVKNNPRLNYVSTAYGDIRLYDKKASPRPSLNKQVTKSKINRIDITDDGNYLFIGDNTGYCAMLDIRKNFSPYKSFKGNTGSIQTLVNIEQNKHLIVSGFDRYVRWYDYNGGDNEKVFVKNKVNITLLVGLEKSKNEEFGDEEEGEIEDSELLEEENEEQEDENDEEESDEKKKKNKIRKENREGEESEDFEEDNEEGEEINDKEEDNNEEEEEFGDKEDDEEGEEDDDKIEEEEREESNDNGEENEEKEESNDKEEENEEIEESNDKGEENEEIEESSDKKEENEEIEESNDKEEENEEGEGEEVNDNEEENEELEEVDDKEQEEKEEAYEEDEEIEESEKNSDKKEGANEEIEEKNDEEEEEEEEEEEDDSLKKEQEEEIEDEEIDNEEEDEEEEEEESESINKKRKREKNGEDDIFKNKNNKKKKFN